VRPGTKGLKINWQRKMMGSGRKRMRKTKSKLKAKSENVKRWE
jgi:hypothetical protein